VITATSSGAQIQRVVPRNDDADHAQRSRLDLGARGQEPFRHPDTLRRHPAPTGAQRAVDLGEARKELGDLRLDRRPSSKVAVDGLFDDLFVFRQHSAQPLQAVPPFRPFGVRLPRESGALQFVQ